MFFDDLPIWGFFGRPKRTPDPLYYLYTHSHFDIEYNGDRVIGLNVSTNPDSILDITDDKAVEVKFSYSVKWSPTNLPFERRLEQYSKYSFQPKHLEVGI